MFKNEIIEVPDENVWDYLEVTLGEVILYNQQFLW